MIKNCQNITEGLSKRKNFYNKKIYIIHTDNYLNFSYIPTFLHYFESIVPISQSLVLGWRKFFTTVCRLHLALLSSCNCRDNVATLHSRIFTLLWSCWMDSINVLLGSSLVPLRRFTVKHSIKMLVKTQKG